MSAKKPQTFAKRAREQAVKEKRDQKRARKAEAAAHRGDPDWAGNGLIATSAEDGGEQIALSPDNGGKRPHLPQTAQGNRSHWPPAMEGISPSDEPSALPRTSRAWRGESVTLEPAVLLKPKLRGVFHEFGFYAAVALAVPLVATAEPGRARISAVVFSTCVALCFGVSALYHRPTWSPRIRSRLARLDHAGVYLLIAGTYTPFGLLVLSPDWAIPVLAIVWTGVVAAIALKLFHPRVPKRVSAAIGIALGWVGVAAVTQLLKLPVAGFALVLAGGVFYTLGAIIYVRKRPDPNPRVLGYHELFHLLTIVAASCQYAAIAFYVLPRA